jgi:hypothetical protein
MKPVPILVLATLAAAACSERAPEPLSPDVEALVASAPDWTPAELARDLAVDDATRQEIEATLGDVHEAMAAFHERHRVALTLEGEARETYLEELHADAVSFHEQHREIWEGLDADVREQLHARMEAHGHQTPAHEAGNHGGLQHDEATMRSMHERMRKLHGAGGDAPRAH